MNRILSIVILLIPIACFSQTTTIVATGNWSDIGIWQNSEIGDTITEDVIYKDGVGFTATVLNGKTFTIGNLTFSNSDHLVIEEGGRLNVGSETNNKIVTANNNATIVIYGDFYIYGDLIVNNNLTLIVTGTFVVTGDITVNNNSDIIVEAGGSIEVGGSLTVGNNSTLTGSGTVTVGGSCTGSTDFCDSVLPVELLFFNAKNKDQAIQLTWATASEENFDYFTLERSSDAVNYEIIGTVPGNRWSDRIINYSFTDTYPLIGRAYYRLKSTDLDGTFEYFQPVMVDIISNRRSIKLENNPVRNGVINFRLNFHTKTHVEVVVTDLSGVAVFTGSYAPAMSGYSISTDLSEGIYLLKVSTEGNSYIVRVLKN